MIHSSQAGAKNLQETVKQGINQSFAKLHPISTKEKQAEPPSFSERKRKRAFTQFPQPTAFEKSVQYSNQDHRRMTAQPSQSPTFISSRSPQRLFFCPTIWHDRSLHGMKQPKSSDNTRSTMREEPAAASSQQLGQALSFIA